MLKKNSRQTKLEEFIPKKHRQTKLTEFGFTFLVCVLLAGCTEMIPDTTLLVRGHLYQGNNSTFTFTDGYAPNIGKVYAHFFYLENATYKYEIHYIEWKV